MNKSVIVYGPQGCGKGKHAARIAKHFGLARVVEEWDGTRAPYSRHIVEPMGVLYLTSLPEAEICKALNVEPGTTRRVLSFADIAQQINDAIPLTPWRTGRPPAVGEWIASHTRSESHRRYWNGERWSHVFGTDFDQETKNRQAGQLTSLGYDFFEYRGLAEEPIIVPAAA